MSTGGWIFMLCLVGAVLCLVSWCYYKILTMPD